MTRLILFFIMISALTAPLLGQAHEPDPVAMKAFTDVLQSYRERPALEITETVKIELKDGKLSANSREIKANFKLLDSRTGRVSFNGFIVWLAPDDDDDDESGMIYTVHDSTKDKSYFSMADDGSPYYALFSLFVETPFPHLAIAFGEEKPTDVLMQLNRKTPWIQPTSVKVKKTGDNKRKHIMLTSDDTETDIAVDPETNLIQTMKTTITGGQFVQPGATLVYTYKFEYNVPDEPFDSADLTFEPGDRQRVDVLAQLVDQPKKPAGGGEELVGKQAPPVVLATADGGAIDLEDMRGKVVVLDFWATWCGPCMKALPMLHDVADWTRNEQLPVTIMTVNTFERGDNPDKVLENVRHMWKQKEFTLPIAMDYSNETAGEYGVRGIPHTVVIRSDGVVHAQHAGFSPNYADDLKESIEGAIAAVAK